MSMPFSIVKLKSLNIERNFYALYLLPVGMVVSMEFLLGSRQVFIDICNGVIRTALLFPVLMLRSPVKIIG